MDFLKVDGHDGLVRDQNTGAILNLDDSAIAKEEIHAAKFRIGRHKYIEE